MFNLAFSQHIYMGQFFSECNIGNVRHIGTYIDVYSYVPIVHFGKNCHGNMPQEAILSKNKRFRHLEVRSS